MNERHPSTICGRDAGEQEEPNRERQELHNLRKKNYLRCNEVSQYKFHLCMCFAWFCTALTIKKNPGFNFKLLFFTE